MGQRKHTTWIRDQNRNFIDDEIERRFGPGQRVNVIVNLNECISGTTIAALRQFGDFRYASRLVTFALINDVRFEDLPHLAALPEVAMVEWQAPLYLATDVSTRAIQVRKSGTYSPQTAEDRPASFNEATIAILDSGVDDGVHEALPRMKFVAGFDATRFTDTNNNGIDDSCEPAPVGNGSCADPDDEPRDGTTNPVDDQGHGTSVAHIALGVGTAGRQECSREQGSSDPGTCAGVAPRAKLVDIKIGTAAGVLEEDLFKGIDWLGINAAKYSIRVANLSIAQCLDDDGTSAHPTLINYVVALGVVFVVGHGNASACSLTPGTVFTQANASAAYAIAVAGTHDNDKVSRSDDGVYAGYLQGPRRDFNLASPNLGALKPDISAPAQGIVTAKFKTASQYSSGSGTSLAAPHVAGAAAIVLGTRQLDPGSLKELLKKTADTTLNNAAYPMIDASWDTSFGSGMLNVWPALAAVTADVGFPSCVGPPVSPGQPCVLAPPQPYWLNEADISTDSPPRVGATTTIRARVKNFSGDPATVMVDFGVYHFAAGNNQFFHIGTKRVTIAPGATETVFMPWTPTDAQHQCIQVSIAFGEDSNVNNNVTQRNLEIAPSRYIARIENPLMAPARMDLTPTSTRPGWRCTVDQPTFTLDPFTDCPRQVRISFDAPPGAPPGATADCHVALTATPLGSATPQPAGGVTVRTFVPQPCRVIGSIWTPDGAPVAKARLSFTRVRENGEPLHEKPGQAVSEKDGIFSVALGGGVSYAIRIAADAGSRPVIVKAECGPGTVRLVWDRRRGLYEAAEYERTFGIRSGAVK